MRVRYVIVADIETPGEDGYAFIRRVRALDADAGGRTPAVALTAYARTKDRNLARSAGYTMHVPKTGRSRRVHRDHSPSGGAATLLVAPASLVAAAFRHVRATGTARQEESGILRLERFLTRPGARLPAPGVVRPQAASTPLHDALTTRTAPRSVQLVLLERETRLSTFQESARVGHGP